MTSDYFQQPRALRSGSPEQTKTGFSSAELDQRCIDDRKSLDAAISEGWPVLQPRARAANPRPQRPYRTGAQTWLRRKIIKSQP
jgi:hypothetical protein